MKIYNTTDIKEENLIVESSGEDTYTCGHCNIDSVIFDNTCNNLDIELLQKLHYQYFLK